MKFKMIENGKYESEYGFKIIKYGNFKCTNKKPWALFYKGNIINVFSTLKESKEYAELNYHYYIL